MIEGKSAPGLIGAFEGGGGGMVGAEVVASGSCGVSFAVGWLISRDSSTISKMPT